MTEGQKKFWRWLLKPFLGGIRAQWFYEKLHILGLKGMHFGRGSTIDDSGERHVLKYIRQKLQGKSLPVIFDVGAHSGEYSQAVLEEFAAAEIYAFEPLDFVYQKLSARFEGRPNVHTFQQALSSQAGTHELYFNKKYPLFTSLYNRKLDYIDAELDEHKQVAMVTLDEFCARKNVPHIDFLKLDVEGHELSVLQGAARMLAEKRITYIQFEFGGANIDSRTFFQDYWYLLKDNYVIYRIVKNGLRRIDNYREINEVFLTINYLAERKQ